MEIETTKNTIILHFPLTTPTGKIRVKRPIEGQIAQPVAVRSFAIEQDDYLEWQISYDTETPMESTVVKELILNKEKGVRYGCELAKLWLDALRLEMLSSNNLEDLIELANKSSFGGIENNEIIEKKPFSENTGSLQNELGFIRYVQAIPNYIKNSDKYSVEIKLAHKQRAVGIQAMIYVWIPIKFCKSEDGTKIIGRTAIKNERVIYEINKENADLILDATRAFCVASKRHSNDMKMILEATKKLK